MIGLKRFWGGSLVQAKDLQFKKVPQFPALTSSQEDMGKMVAKFEDMVKSKPV
jgi:hypothetical protein